MVSPAVRRKPRPQTLEEVELPAPSGGINTVDPLGAMPATDAIYAYNLIRGQYGMQSRLGFQEWVTNLTGGADSSVRTVLPYQGSKKNGAADKLFAVTATGIWDCSNSTQAPTKSIAFSFSGLDAGYGSSHAFTTPAGHFMLFCDEQNGLFLYTESTGAWAAVVGDVAAPWTASTFVVAGTEVINDSPSRVYVCKTGGTTGSGAGPTGTGAGITDGSTVTWDYVKPAVANAIGPSIADQNNGLYVGAAAVNLPSSFAFVTVWASRLWLVERDTSRAWFLNVNSIFGAATAQDFGIKMRVGGPLIGLYGWSYDAGAGMATRLVGISSAGDIVIYGGTDPTSAQTFGLVGAWYLPGPPYGRRCAVEYGGDMLVICQLGVVPLSKLIVGNAVEFDKTQYTTYKVSKLFSQLVTTFGGLQGWAIVVHPQDNALLILVPQPAGYAPLQLAMSFTTRAWSVYRGLPMLSAAAWSIGPGGKQLFFGTADGRLCQNTGYVDNVQLASPSSYTAIAWSLLHAYHAEDGRFKVMRQARPHILSQVPNPVIEVVAKFDYDTGEPADTSSSGAGGSGTWDNATWDQSIWQSDSTPFNPTIGLVGAGRAVAIAVRGQAVSLTTYVGSTVYFEPGGLM